MPRQTTERAAEFNERVAPFRRELLVHCYRMLGSLDEAEDLAQESLLRAWRFYEGFEARSSLRVWLYRIATNVCLTALTQRGRRAIPSGLGGPSDDPDAPETLAGPNVHWLQPIPDTSVVADSADPAIITSSRHDVRLALIASLQLLPPRQRAALILREVLSWSATEIATALDTTAPAVKSMLQRARARLRQAESEPDDIVEPTDPLAQELLAHYIEAFEKSDPKVLEAVLRRDAALEAVPSRTWFAGKQTCIRFIESVMGVPGEWKMWATIVNGQPGVAAYRRDLHGIHQAFGIAVLTVTATGIARIVVFGDPGLVPRFGFPTRFPAA